MNSRRNKMLGTRVRHVVTEIDTMKILIMSSGSVAVADAKTGQMDGRTDKLTPLSICITRSKSRSIFEL